MEQKEVLPLPHELRPRQETSIDLLDHWEELRGPRRRPHRREVRPTDLGTTLSSTFMIEDNGDGLAGYRLAGSTIFELFQRELRGLQWLALFEEDTRPQAESAGRAVLNGDNMALILAEGRTARHRTVPLEIVLLPLETDAGETRRALGSLVACDRPYWLGAQPLVELSVIDVEIMPVDRPAGAVPVPREHREPATAHEGPIRRLRHLALYLGGQAR